MKVNGQSTRENTIFPAPGKPLAFKRGNGFIGFYAQPVWDMDEFNKLCPEPKNKQIRFNKNAPDGKEPDPNSPAHKEALAKYGKKRWGYIVLKSLEPSAELGLQWEKASLQDPNSWGLVEEELKESLSLYEYARVMKLVDEANALDDAKLEANAESFFRGQHSEEGPKNSPLEDPENS